MVNDTLSSKNIRWAIIGYSSIALTLFLSFIFAEPAAAYIGPGAGFAFISSFFVLFASLAVAVLILLSAPFRFLVRMIRGQRKRKGFPGRVIIIGLDGLDPALAKKMMDGGELPDLSRLRDQGCFSPLKTTCPPISPVAWSSFATGVTPARHNIFDFLTPDRKTYFPILSSSEIRPASRRLRIGRYFVPIGRPTIRLLRKGRPFWNILGDHGIFSTVIRVPITFPPEPFRGHLLSAMCVPDLKGTQGTFTLYTSAGESGEIREGGEIVRVKVKDSAVASFITGPENTMKAGGGNMKLPFSISWEAGGEKAALKLQGKKITLRVGRYSDWTPLEFRASLGIKISGTCRFYLKRLEPVFELYVSPINIDPERPAMPISHPFVYSIYLSKMLGRYATLGLAEDTWALNERVLDEKAFLEQCCLNHEEREKMLFHALSRTRSGVSVCVFDTTDRIQHMFWRYHERCDHQPLDGYEEFRDTIKDLYRRMDSLIGRVMEKLRRKDILIVMSDHGFKSFRRSVDLNSWLEKEGYLVRRADSKGEKWLRDVDWRRTKAYALGLAGIYLNLEGRERHGCVKPSDAAALRSEIAGKLKGLKDADSGMTAVVNTYIPHEIMSGPYLDGAPDIIVGYNEGYRASWDCAVGKIGGAVFENNIKSWSGDHCIDPEKVPGSFFCNLKLNGRAPEMIDIAPTVLSLFGIVPPANMEGRPLFQGPDRK